MRPVRTVSLTLFLALIFLSLFSKNAFAATHSQLRNFVGKRHDPKISYFVSDDGLSGFNCGLDRVFVEGKDPVGKHPRTINLKQYRPGKGMPNSGRAVIILPPTGGENVLDNKWANSLCKRGFRVVIVQSWQVIEDNELNLSMYDRMSLRSLSAVLHVTEYLSQTGAKSIGLLGTSLGAIQGSAAVSYDSRIKAATFIVGGINLPEILAVSTEVEIAAMRRIRLDAWKMTTDSYRVALDNALVIEPGDFIGMTGAKKILSVIATKDKTVPTANQQKLYEAYGKQELITIKKDHLGAVKEMSLLYPLRVLEFFEQNL